MLNIFKHAYHHIFKNYWFYRTLTKNVNKIFNNPKLTDKQKGNQIYYHVFWETWHECNEPSLKDNYCSILDVGSFIKSKLSQLNWSCPAKKSKLLREYSAQNLGIGIGQTIQHVQLDLDLWHFGTDPHLDDCLEKAFH